MPNTFHRQTDTHTCAHFPYGSDGKESTCIVGDLGSIPGLGRSPGGGARQPTPVFWPGESPWTEEPGGLQSVEWQRVQHDWATQHSKHTPLKGIACIFWCPPKLEIHYLASPSTEVKTKFRYYPLPRDVCSSWLWPFLLHLPFLFHSF